MGLGSPAAQEPPRGNCALGAQLQAAILAGPPPRSSAGACLCNSARLPPEFLGPLSPGSWSPVSNRERSAGHPRSAREALAPGLRRQATAAGVAGGARGPRKAGSIPRQRRLSPRSLGLPGWGGAGIAEVAVAGPIKPDGARPATHLSRVAVARSRPLHSDRAAAVPNGSRAHSPSHDGQSDCGGDGPRPGLGGDPGPRAGARDSARSSLPLLAACLCPSPARGALGPRGSGPGTQVPRRRQRVRLQAPTPRATLPAPWPRRFCGAERSGAERSAHCSLVLRKATLAAGRRDAGLTHARARVNARLWGREQGSDGRPRQRGWAEEAGGCPGSSLWRPLTQGPRFWSITRF